MDPLACGPRAGVVPEADSGVGGGVRVGHGEVEGMTSGPHRSATAGEGGGGLLGQLGRLCFAELRRGASCWAAARRGAACVLQLLRGLERLRPAVLEGKMGRWFRNLGKGILEGIQANRIQTRI
jgi:hypothetical protein